MLKHDPGLFQQSLHKRMEAFDISTSVNLERGSVVFVVDRDLTSGEGQRSHACCPGTAFIDLRKWPY
jgi:hypothetical protein